MEVFRLSHQCWFRTDLPAANFIRIPYAYVINSKDGKMNFKLKFDMSAPIFAVQSNAIP